MRQGVYDTVQASNEAKIISRYVLMLYDYSVFRRLRFFQVYTLLHMIKANVCHFTKMLKEVFLFFENIVIMMVSVLLLFYKLPLAGDTYGD